MKNNKKNLRRVSVVVTAQTLWNLEGIATAAGYKNIGRVIDKLTREKMISLNSELRPGCWVYESHLGGLYTSTKQIPFDHRYCEDCGDVDEEIGYANTRAELTKMVEEYDRRFGCYRAGHIINKAFPLTLGEESK